MRLEFFAGLRPLSRSGAVRDVLAGVTLASMNIPQVLGYTRIAGTPVVTGLYTVLLPLVAFAVFGSSRHLVVAADSATAAIFSSSLSTMAPPASAKYMALVGMVALLTAGFLLLARILKLGFLADFLSRTVLVGFLTGVGIQVGIAMLGDMFGVATQSHRRSCRPGRFCAGCRGSMFRPRCCRCWWRQASCSAVACAPRLPVSLIAVVGTIAASAGFDFAGARHRRHRPGPRRTAVDRVARGELERNPGAAAGCRVMLRHDHRAKRGDRARIRVALSRAGRRERGHPRAGGRECRRRHERGVRGQRQPDPDRHGGSRGRAQPGRPTRLRRRRAGRAAVPDRPAAVPAALRAGGHRVHDRGRHDRRCRACATSAAKARANSPSPSPPPPWW